MQWVETTGRTVEDAKEAALDQLGIDASEAEFEVIEEPKTGLFGRMRNEARVRARVKPKSPRPKQERRPRRTRARKDDAPAATDGAGSPSAADVDDDGDVDVDATEEGSPASEPRTGERAPRRRRSSKPRSAPTNQEGSAMTDEVVSVDQQADIITEFLEGLLEAVAIPGTVVRNAIDDETIELSVESESTELGLLIGPKGQTLTSVHELARAVLQRRAPGRHDGRVRIDIGGYRRRRQEALARFVTQQAEAVAESGVSRALEPMNAVDRKIVHDTVNEVAGVATISEGVDPDRRVVIVPATSE
jgi:spoIIIJ-associated protein